jgi:hypothetical protein
MSCISPPTLDYNLFLETELQAVKFWCTTGGPGNMQLIDVIFLSGSRIVSEPDGLEPETNHGSYDTGGLQEFEAYIRDETRIHLV